MTAGDGLSSRLPNLDALIASWTPARRTVLERLISQRLYDGDERKAGAYVGTLLREGILAERGSNVEPTVAGRSRITSKLADVSVESKAEVSRILLRSMISGVEITAASRIQLRSGALVRAQFFTRQIYNLRVPLESTAAKSIVECARVVGCAWARKALGEITESELRAGTRKTLQQRFFCLASGTTDFAPDRGFIQLINDELSSLSISVHATDSDWQLLRALTKMAMRRPEPLTRDSVGDADALELVASAIGTVVARTLSKWALIADVYRAMPSKGRPDLVTFKQSLIDLVEAGSLELSPIVVQQSVDVRDQETSELTFGGRQYHFVRIRRT